MLEPFLPFINGTINRIEHILRRFNLCPIFKPKIQQVKEKIDLENYYEIAKKYVGNTKKIRKILVSKTSKQHRPFRTMYMRQGITLILNLLSKLPILIIIIFRQIRGV